MMMKMLLGSMAALSIATAAHAQLAGYPADKAASNIPSGVTVLTNSKTAFDVEFTLPAFTFVNGSITFTLTSPAEVTFSGYTDAEYSTGALSGPSLPALTPTTGTYFSYTSASATTTIDLAAQTYTFFVNGSGYGPGNLFVNVSAVPEPSTYAMLLAGLGVVGVIGARRRRTPTLQRQTMC